MTASHKNRTSIKGAIWIFALITLYSARPALSEDGEYGLVQDIAVNGFFTQGYINTSGNNFMGDTKEKYGDWTPTEAAINSRIEFNERLAFSGQILAREAGEFDTQNVEIDYFFLDISTLSKETSSLDIRVGRDKYILGFFNETRDVAITKPSILLPQSIYYDRVRNLLAQHDGIHIRASSFIGSQKIDYGASYAWDSNTSEVDTEYFLIGFDAPGKFDTDYVVTAHAGTGSLDHGWATKITAGYGFEDYKPANIDFLEAGTAETGSLTFSVSFADINYSVTFEHLEGLAKAQEFGPLLADSDYNWQGTYLQYTRRLEDFEIFGRYDWFRIKDKDKDEFIAQGVPEDALYQKDFTVGGRYYINPKMAVSAEYHDIEGNGLISIADNPDFSSREKFWGLFAMQFTVVF